MAGGIVTIQVPVNGVQRQMRFWSSDGTAAGDLSPVGSDIPLSVDAAAWSPGSTAKDFHLYGEVELQVSGLSGGDSITVTRSQDDVQPYTPQSWVDATFATGTAITADGCYNFTGSAFMKWTKTGTASTPTVTVRARG